MSISHKSLLIITCTKEKDEKSDLLPAWERYQGKIYTMLKKLGIEGGEHHAIDIVIISGKYGFLRPSDLIAYYDQRMTPVQAKILHEDISTKILEMLNQTEYQDAFILLEPVYLTVLNGINIPHAQIEQTITSQTLEKLKQWVLNRI